MSPAASSATALAAVKSGLVTLHRWVGLLLAPLFILIIVTGGVLALRPIVADLSAQAAREATVDPAALAALLRRIEAGTEVNALTVTDGGRLADIAAAAPGSTGRWEIAAARYLGAPLTGDDVFRVAQRLHKSLMLGLNIVVEVATYAMVLIMVLGPFLAWLRFRNSLIGWHIAVGWCLLPLTLLSPATAVLMTLGLDTGTRPRLPRVEPALGIGQALAVAGRELDLTRLTAARRFRGGTVMVQVAGTGAGAAGGNYLVTDKGVSRLAGGPGLMKQIHEGTWGGAWSGGLNVIVALALLGLTVTGFWSWFRRWRRDRPVKIAAGADILVAHASQTGTAARLAAATCAALAKGGERATVAPLGSVTVADLRRFRLVLVIAASTGEGEVPDGARHFVTALAPGAAQGAEIAILGLGDRAYARFCGGAEAIRDALLAAGAREAVPMARADGDPATAWAVWLDTLGADLDLKCAAPAAPPAAATLDLVLAARRRLDDPAAGETQETWCITLESGQDLAFRPGDLVRLAPPGGGRERAYSVGSSSRVDPRRIVLTVRLHRWRDESGQAGFGRVSGWLVREAQVGERLRARLDAHPAFHPPADPKWPVMLIGAGSGMAPFPGFLTERRASGHAGPAWLLFGNRHRDGDFLWRDLCERSLADGTLTRLDTAFSRDAADGRHVQDRLMEAAAEVHRWVMDRKAVIYVCGRREMARGVEEALAAIRVAHGGLDVGAARAEVARWLAEGRLRVDAFD